MGSGGTIPNPTLQPALSTEIEAGIDLRFFNDRLGVDFTYYHQKTTDDIIQQSISNATGFGNINVNIGELRNEGFEIALTGTPIQGDLIWDIMFNIARNNNEVVSLLPGLTNLVPNAFDAEPRTRNALIQQIVGYPFGTITGRVQQVDPNGNLIFMENGSPLASTDFVPIGNGIAKATGGLNNSFTYKGINLSFLIDFRIGGDIFSGTNNRLTQWGLSEQSLQGRAGEQPIHITGVTRSGEGTDESPYVFTEVDRDLTPHEAFNYWDNVGGETTAITTMWLHDGSFAKIRQLTLGYSLPSSMLQKTPFKTVSITFVARNLALLYKDIPNVDPESAYSNQAGAQGLEYFAMPTTRSFGFNLGLGF